MNKKPSNKSLTIRIIRLVSGIAFLFSTLFLFVRLWSSAPSTTTSSPNAPTQEEVRIQQLEAQAKGYEAVLAREPENPTALQGLVEVRLQLNDLEGAIPPLEKLVALYPEEENLKLLLSTIKEQLANQQAPQSPQPQP